MSRDLELGEVLRLGRPQQSFFSDLSEI